MVEFSKVLKSVEVYAASKKVQLATKSNPIKVLYVIECVK